jgi:hypothetical protein
MADTQASEAARALVNVRWRGQVAEKAAQVVISRAAELSPSTRAEVVGALTEQKDAGGA